MSNTMTNAPQRAEMKVLEEKMAMLVQTGRMDNLVDLLAVLSDQIEMTTPPMVEKMIATVDKLAATGFVTENAVRGARRATASSEVPSLFGLLKLMKDEEVRRGLAFVLQLTKHLGRQL